MNSTEPSSFRWDRRWIVVGALAWGCGPAPIGDSVDTQAELLKLSGTATASSSENSTLGPAKAVDGNVTTRWSSAFSDPQWLQVDLGSSKAINRVVLRWEAAYSTSYDIQFSNDAAMTTSRSAQRRPST
jgi:F5/8 type C domain